MLPIKLPWQRAETIWKAQMDPIISNPLNNVKTIDNVTLNAGANVINHYLGKKPSGWFLTDIQSDSVVYRTAWNDKTITLFASADSTVNIGVF